jgi:hypothetical protein
MINTVQALVVFAYAVLPGYLFVRFFDQGRPRVVLTRSARVACCRRVSLAPREAFPPESADGRPGTQSPGIRAFRATAARRPP